MRKVKKPKGSEFHKQALEAILGHHGGVCSFSKTMGPPMAVYNSHVLVNYDKVWNGDIVLDNSTRKILCNYATYHDVCISVSYESGGEVWTTDTPEELDGMEIGDAIEFRERRSEERIKDRLSSLGILTPRGTDWTWYNAWFYKSIWVIGEKIHNIYDVFIRFPFRCAFFVHSYDNSNKGSVIDKTLYALKVFRKELHFQRFQGGLLHFWKFKLFG